MVSSSRTLTQIVPSLAAYSALAWLRQYAIVALVLAMAASLSVIAPNFASMRNIFNVLDQNAPLMMTAMGTTLVIIAGGFDLSSGKILSLAGITGALVTVTTGYATLGVLAGVLSGIPAGILNGWLIGRLRMNSFLATLATSLVLSGLAMLATGGFSIDLSGNDAFRYVGSTRYGIVPLSVILTFGAFVLLTLLLSYSVLGRHIYAVGSNPEAARLSGLSTSRIKMLAYSVGGVCAAIGGMFLVTRTGVGNIYINAPTLTLNAIAAVVIGGSAISGGSGAIWRTVLGVILLALTQNALNLLNIQPFWQEVVSGLIIILALLANAGSRARG